MISSNIPWLKPQFLTDAGLPAAGYKLFTYDAGSTTKRNTYSDAGLTSANANPIILDASGSAWIFCLPQSYKYVLAPPADSDPPVAPGWTEDNVLTYAATGNTFNVDGVAGETLAAFDVVYLSDGSGGATAGRWYKADADQTYSSSMAMTVGVALAPSAAGLVVTLQGRGRVEGFVGLTAGAIYYVSATAGGITSTAPANARPVGKADSTTSLVLDPNWGYADEGYPGIISTGAQVFPGSSNHFVSTPTVGIGASLEFVPVGGTFFKDVALHSVPQNSTNLSMSLVEIPANWWDTDGRQIVLRFGTTNNVSGGNNITPSVKLEGTSIVNLRTFAGAGAKWAARVTLTRLDSDEVEFSGFIKGSASASLFAIPTTIRGSLDFTQPMDLETQCTTGASTSTDQTYLTASVIG